MIISHVLYSVHCQRIRNILNKLPNGTLTTIKLHAGSIKWESALKEFIVPRYYEFFKSTEKNFRADLAII